MRDLREGRNKAEDMTWNPILGTPIFHHEGIGDLDSPHRYPPITGLVQSGIPFVCDTGSKGPTADFGILYKFPIASLFAKTV